MDVKEDILQCDSAELSFALSRFIREVRRPNGETYSPDSIFYLCLGIQQVHTHTYTLISTASNLTLLLLSTYSLCLLVGQYLFMQGRIENIFTDELYSQFATEITEMLQLWRPKLPGGMITDTVTSHTHTVFTIQDFQGLIACNFTLITPTVFDK